jgi:hypothetical protein
VKAECPSLPLSAQLRLSELNCAFVYFSRDESSRGGLGRHLVACTYVQLDGRQVGRDLVRVLRALSDTNVGSAGTGRGLRMLWVRVTLLCV